MTTPAFFYRIKAIRSEASLFGPDERWLRHADGREKIFFWERDVIKELGRLRESTVSPNIRYEAHKFDVFTKKKMGVIK